MHSSKRNRLLRKADTYSGSFVAYAGVSVVSALTEWLTFALALAAFGPLAAAACGFMVATLLNFVLSRYLAFRSVRPLLQDLVLVYAMSGVAFVANIGVFYLLYSRFAISLLYAKVLGTCAGFVFNYLFRQFFIFSPIPRIAPIAPLLRARFGSRRHASRGTGAPVSEALETRRDDRPRGAESPAARE
jgi:putative flippase GtrA